MQSNKEKFYMKKISRNVVSLSLALALCGSISGMVFAQEAEVAVEAPEPTKWSAPSVTIGTGTFKIEVQSVFNGFLVTTPIKTYDKDTNKLLDAKDTTIVENDDEDWSGKISFSASYDNSDAPGVGYSFGVGGGIRRANNFDGEFNGYFDSPWGKLWLLNKQLWLRAGGPEDPWTAWNDNWSYGDDPGGAVQLNINPTAITALKGLNIGVTLPVPKAESKFDYSFKNMIAGIKLAELIPFTTISAALKLRGGHYDALIAAAETADKAATAANKAKTDAETALSNAAAAANSNATTQEALATAAAKAAAATAAATAANKAKTDADKLAKSLEPLNESMDLNAALDFNLSPIQIRAELQLADLGKGEDDLKVVPISGGDDVKKRSVNIQLHPRLDLSLSKLVDLGAFSLETFTVYAWIRQDPRYVSDGNSNTELSVEWAPSYKLLDNGTNSITASLLFGGYYNVWGGNPEEKKNKLEDTYAYNQIGFTLRPALEFKFGPNAGIRLRDQIKIQQTGVAPERGIENQVQVKFWWGF
jgi:hypothetical protein